MAAPAPIHYVTAIIRLHYEVGPPEFVGLDERMKFGSPTEVVKNCAKLIEIAVNGHVHVAGRGPLKSYDVVNLKLYSFPIECPPSSEIEWININAIMSE